MKRGPNNTPHSRSIELAIAEARRRFLTTGRHHAVVQHFERLSVMCSGVKDAFRPMWTTHDDKRETGVRRPNAKLEIADIPVIAELRLEGFTNAQIAEKFDVHSTTISNAMRGQSWGGVRRLPTIRRARMNSD